MDLLDTIAGENGSALIAITHDLAVASRAARQFRLADGVLTPISISARSAGSLGALGAPGTDHDPGTDPGTSHDHQAEHVARPLVGVAHALSARASAATAAGTPDTARDAGATA